MNNEEIVRENAELKGRIEALEKDTREIKEFKEKMIDVIHNFDITLTEMNGKINVVMVQTADIKEGNKRVEERIQKIEDGNKINLMSDIVKPVLIACVTSVLAFFGIQKFK